MCLLVITEITEYFWDFEVSYELFAYQGNTPNDKVTLQTRVCRYEIMTSAKVTPKPAVNVVSSKDVQLTWLLQQLSEGLQCHFKIDRTSKSCRTPRRNPQIDTAASWFYTFASWCSSVQSYFSSTVFPTQT